MLRGVDPAEPYDPSEMESSGKASGMLIRQYRYPDTYEPRDVHITADLDRLMERDRRFTAQCFETYVGTGGLRFGEWVRNAHHAEVMLFLITVMQLRRRRIWTGFRVLGTVNRGNGYPVWSLCLFAKHPDSATEVYSGDNAPNVRPHHRNKLTNESFLS